MIAREPYFPPIDEELRKLFAAEGLVQQLLLWKLIFTRA